MVHLVNTPTDAASLLFLQWVLGRVAHFLMPGKLSGVILLPSRALLQWSLSIFARSGRLSLSYSYPFLPLFMYLYYLSLTTVYCWEEGNKYISFDLFWQACPITSARTCLHSRIASRRHQTYCPWMCEVELWKHWFYIYLYIYIKIFTPRCNWSNFSFWL